MKLVLSVLVLMLQAKSGVDPATVANKQRAAELNKTHKSLTFGWLSDFEYPLRNPWEKNPPRFYPPDFIQSLDGTQISISGFVIPLDYDGKSMQNFIIVPTVDMCHYGQIGGPNEWMIVTMKGRTEYVADHEVTVYGKLQVGEEFKDGVFQSFYRMNGIAVYNSFKYK
jgi:hypothetical protein